MCEILVATWPEPHRLAELFPLALELERLGIAGFGWGVAWATEDRRVHLHKDTRSLADDEAGHRKLGDVTSDRFLVHLRRPSKLSTVQLADTQPFLDPDGRFAFSHNGLLRHHEQHRGQFASQLKGSADSEVAFELFRRHLERDAPATSLKEVHRVLGGQANFVYLPATGPVLVYGAHRENPFWSFRIESGSMAVTALHSTDDSVFEMVLPEASDRFMVGREPVEVVP